MKRKLDLPFEVPEGYDLLLEGELDLETDMMFVCPTGWMKLSDLPELTRRLLPNDAKDLWAVCRLNEESNGY